MTAAAEAARSRGAEELQPPPSARPAVARLLALLESDPEAPISNRTRGVAQSVHIADSLAGLRVAELAAAGSIADLGAGAGLPGLVLAAVRPEARVDLIESSERKCSFVRRAIAEMGLDNARAVPARAEEWALGEGCEAYEAVSARAVGPLAELAELASPLLREGGALVAWKGTRDGAEEAAAARAAERLAMEPDRVLAVAPYARSRDRHLHVLRKRGPTPPALPRRPGMAHKRPFGSE